jgi:hypothetical protein
MLFRCVSSDCGLTLLTLFNLRQMFIFRSVYLLPCNLDSYLDFSIDHRGQLSVGHWSPDIDLIVKVYLLFYKLGDFCYYHETRFTIFSPHIADGRYTCILINVSPYLNFRFSVHWFILFWTNFDIEKWGMPINNYRFLFYDYIYISFIWLVKSMRFFLGRILSKPSIYAKIYLDCSRGAFGTLDLPHVN